MHNHPAHGDCVNILDRNGAYLAFCPEATESYTITEMSSDEDDE